MIKQKISNAWVRSGKWGKALAALLIACGITLGGIGGWQLYQDWSWPSFPQVADKTDLTPQALVTFKRDYAYRTGDLVHLKLFIKQKAGTVVDPATLSLNDTFELAQKPVVTPRKYDDGSVVYRLDLTVQSFTVARDLTFTGSVAWKNGDQRADLTIPETHIFTSFTYDGRKNLMEGPDPRVWIFWYATRYGLPLLLAAGLYVLIFVPSFKAWLRSLVKPVIVDAARNRVVELLEAVRNGSSTKDQHLELDGLIRDRFLIGPVPASQIELAMTPPSVIAFLKLNEPAIYAEGTLADKERAQLCAKGQTILSRWK